MNRKMVFSMLGKILIVEAGLMLLPIIFGLVYGESSAHIDAKRQSAEIISLLRDLYSKLK